MSRNAGRAGRRSEFDVAVVGAGIVGLAHALAAARRGKRVVVFDRDSQAVGASIRNFGFITVSGQQAGDCWRRAMRSRDVWVEVASQAGIAIEHRGLYVAARRPEAVAVLEAFLATPMGEGCELLLSSDARQRLAALRDDVRAVLWSPHDVRVESRTAIPRLAKWLSEVHGVEFRRSTLVHAVSPPRVETSTGRVHADAVIVCPGHDFQTLFADRIAAYQLQACKLQMLRVALARPVRLGAAVMSDLGLVRYLGYAELAEAAALRKRLAEEAKEALAHGVHLIVVQSADGSLVVGDSHHYGETLDPFASTAVERLILDELNAVLDLPGAELTERWVGTYASASDRLMVVDRPADAVRLVMITSGTGASTSFAIAEEVIDELFG